MTRLSLLIPIFNNHKINPKIFFITNTICDDTLDINDGKAVANNFEI